MRVVKCDMCGQDLSEQHGAYPAYAIHVHATRVPNNHDVDFCVYVETPLSHPMDFCSKRCLHRWLEADAQARRD